MSFFSHILLFLFTISNLAYAKAPVVKKNKQPKRIIRMCCAFGTNIKVFGLPFITLNKIVNSNTLGNHQYLHGKTENNGILYTDHAGFIDIAHVRDQADWTAYLYKQLILLPKGKKHQFDLGKELGNKALTIEFPEDISKNDILDIAGNIAYDLSTWHEIASWFGATKAPILNEKFSSFSFEDNFSNALGVFLGKKAIQSPDNYNTAMDSILLEYLTGARAYSDNASTEKAMLNLAQNYWNPQKSIPNKKLLIERNFNTSKTIVPIVFGEISVASIQLPNKTIQGTSFNSIYQLSFRAGYRFPYRKLFPNRTQRYISTEDFPEIIAYIKQDIFKMNQKQI